MIRGVVVACTISLFFFCASPAPANNSSPWSCGATRTVSRLVSHGGGLSFTCVRQLRRAGRRRAIGAIQLPVVTARARRAVIPPTAVAGLSEQRVGVRERVRRARCVYEQVPLQQQKSSHRARGVTRAPRASVHCRGGANASDLEAPTYLVPPKDSDSRWHPLWY